MQTPRGTHLAQLMALLLLAACPEKDDGSTTEDTGTSSGTTADTTEPTSTAATDTSATGDTDTDTDTSTSTGGPVFPPVDCGDVTCSEGQLCVNPGDDCDYNMMPPAYVPQPSACKDVPPACAQMQDADARAQCLGEMLCPFFDFGGPSNLKDGLLSCPAQSPDCF